MMSSHLPALAVQRLSGGMDGEGLCAGGRRLGAAVDLDTIRQSYTGQVLGGTGANLDLDEIRKGYSKANGEGIEGGSSAASGGCDLDELRRGYSGRETDSDVVESHWQEECGKSKGIFAGLRALVFQCMPLIQSNGEAEFGSQRVGNLAKHEVHIPRAGDELSDMRAQLLDKALKVIP